MNNVMGKRVKLNDYSMEYGSKEKYINVICYYRYKKDNSLYAIGCDESNIQYGIINYGTAHVKENTLLVIGSKDPKQEMIKELVFKLSNNENLDEFELQDLSNIESIEFVSTNKMEIKKEVLSLLVDKFIPKPVEVIAEKKETGTKKKKNNILPIMLILIVLCGLIFYFFIYNKNSEVDDITKAFVCTKESSSNEIDAKLIEDNTYNFNNNDVLKSINKSTTYKFYDEEEYQEFINKGLYYKYLSNDNSGFTKDDDKYSFIIVENVDTTKDYFLPTEYEEALSYYKKQGYTCTEENNE